MIDFHCLSINDIPTELVPWMKKNTSFCPRHFLCFQFIFNLFNCLQDNKFDLMKSSVPLKEFISLFIHYSIDLTFTGSPAT